MRKAARRRQIPTGQERGHAAGGATAPSRQASACAGGMADQYLVYTSL